MSELRQDAELDVNSTGGTQSLIDRKFVQDAGALGAREFC